VLFRSQEDMSHAAGGDLAIDAVFGGESATHTLQQGGQSDLRKKSDAVIERASQDRGPASLGNSAGRVPGQLRQAAPTVRARPNNAWYEGSA